LEQRIARRITRDPERYLARMDASGAGLPAGASFLVADPASAWTRDDKAWFERYPGRSYRIRLVWPGELAAHGLPEDSATHSVVRQLRPGVRVRTFCNPPAGFPGDTGALSNEAPAHALFDVLTEHYGRGVNHVPLGAVTERIAQMRSCTSSAVH
jgi:hypothetical protein